MIASDFTTVLPEVLLSLYAMLALVVFVYTGKDRHAVLSIWLTSGAFLFLALKSNLPFVCHHLESCQESRLKFEPILV